MENKIAQLVEYFDNVSGPNKPKQQWLKGYKKAMKDVMCLIHDVPISGLE